MEKKYFAFISYQRKDEKLAEWLRRKLEGYHLPAKIKRENHALPKALRPIFRDSLELSGGFLAQEIEKALNDSRYLIVVCSPNSAASPWVNKEVQSFIDQGREDCIVPYIIAGTPFSGDEATECFPPALRSLQGEKEILGININELGRDASVIKVVARMFGLSFDTLWQRHNREQRRKRIAWAFVAVLLILISFFVSGYFFKVNREIEQKNREILQQSREIEEKSDEISRKNIEVTQKNEEIAGQYREIEQKNREITERNQEILRGRDKLLISQSKYLVSEAKKEYEKGNITKALRLALYALPKDLKNPDRPYVMEAEAMLRGCDMPISKDIYCRTVFTHNNEVSSIAFSPCETFILVSSGNKIFKYDITTGKQLKSFCNGSSFCLSAGSEKLAIVTGSSTQVWDIKENKPVAKPIQHGKSIASVGISPNGESIVVAYNDNTALVWDVSTGKAISEPIKHKNKISSANFSTDGKHIVTASWDRTVRIWDTKSGKNTASSPLEYYMPNSAQFSPDNKYVVTASNDRIAHAWEVATGNPLTGVLRHSRRVNSAVFSPDGKYILTASSDSTACLWDVKTGKLAAQPLKHDASVLEATFSHSGKYILTRTSKQTVHLWSIFDSAFKEFEFIHDDFIVNTAAYSPCGRYIVTATMNKVYVWDVKTGEPILQPSLHSNTIVSATFSPDGKYIATASMDSTATVWNTRKMERISVNDRTANELINIWTKRSSTKSLRHNSVVYSAVFSPDSKYIITASLDSTARIWDTETGKLIKIFLHNGAVNSAGFSPCGKYIVSASDDKAAHIWNAKTGELIKTYQHNGAVNSASFSPCGKYIVTTNGNVAYIWNTKSGKTVTETLHHYLHVNTAHFSPCGKYIVTASNDGTIRIWDAKTGRPIIEPLKNNSPVSSAVFSPCGKYIVTASYDKTARIWPFPPLQEIIDKYRKDPEHDWSLSQEEKDEYSLE